MKEREVLLIVDDEPDMLALLEKSIAKEVDWEIITVSSAHGALEVIGERAVDLVLLDIRMPEMDGMELLPLIKESGEQISVVMMTAYGTIDLAVESIRKGAYDFVTKPFDHTRLMLTLQKGMEHQSLVRENLNLHRLIKGKDVFQRMVGASLKMRKVFECIRTVAMTDATVLIAGESGTGKELAARAVHDLSPRKKGPFVTVNCPALPENILEAELFGYTKGAFTDAKFDKNGLFQEADGGTIFLDEIGDLPGNLQSKLLRVLQEKEIRPLGRAKSLKVDVRVVASTNRNLRELIAEGRFREDLYYRLNVVSVELPLLRDRRGDIPLLASHFLNKYAEEFEKPDIKLAEEVMDLFCDHPWNGNVRELENMIKRAVITARSDTISPKDLDPEMRGGCLVTRDVNDLPYHEAKNQVLLNFNTEYLKNVMREHKGNVTYAAKRCEIRRQALQQLLKRYGIRADKFRSNN
jgi:DNA-binding NtrC family response regulator